MEKTNEKRAVALSSVFASAGLTAMKLIVGLLTGSMGILSEAAHSALDLGAAALTYVAVRVGDKPADDDHPFGHGKVESVSALAETGLLFLTSIWIVYEAVRRLLTGHVEVEVTWFAFAVMFISIIVDITRSRALKRVAQETKSQALEADALHFSSDILSSAVVVVGLALTAFGIGRADAFAAIGVAVFVLIAGYRLGKRTIDVLIDTAPEGMAEVVRELVPKIPGVIAVERVRVRSLGMTAFIDMVVTIDRALPLTRAQALTATIEQAVRDQLPGADVVVHQRVAPMADEAISQTVQVLAGSYGLSVHDITIDNVGDHRHVSYDLEVPSSFTVSQAHAMATKLENAIQQEVPSTIECNTHIEPMGTEIVQSQKLSEALVQKFNQTIVGIVPQAPPLFQPHNVVIRKVRGKILITLHCLAPGDILLDMAHDAASRLKYLIKEAIPDVHRAIVHVEPDEPSVRSACAVPSDT